MSTSHVSPVVVAGAALLLLLQVASANAFVIDDGVFLPPVSNMQQVGTPTWTPTDFHLFAATIGTFASGLAEFSQLAQDLLPPPNHELFAGTGIFIGPGVVHSGYDHEFGDGLANLGLHDAMSFNVMDFTLPRAVVLVWMTVPTQSAPTGASPDGGVDGPIIPNNKFPITVDGDLFRNGILYDPAFDVSVPGLDTVKPPFTSADGHSHFPNFLAGAQDFVPGVDPLGQYELVLKMLDASGNGWNAHLNFSVVPLPAAAWLLLTGVAGLAPLIRRRVMNV